MLRVSFLFLAFAGCGRGDGEPSADRRAHLRRELFGGPAERQFDFGTVLGAANRRLSHTYTLTNTLDQPVKVLRVFNAKPCCGAVQAIAPVVLQPGQSTHLTVTLHIGVESIGPLQHRAIVETNHPTAPAVEFWTLATVQPRVRLEAVAETAAPLLPNATARRTFEIFAYGTPAEPPPVLDEAQVRSGLEAVWDGPARERVLDHGLIERSRSLVVLLKGAGKAGQRADELEIVEGGRTLLTYPLHWEVLEAVKAVPAGFVVAGSSEREEKQVLLQTQDGRAFQITGIESGLAGVEAEAALRTPKQRHLVRIRALPGPENRGRSGDLIIATDHPAQQVIKVAVFVTGTEPGPGR